MIREAFSRSAEKQEGPNRLDFLDAILNERPDLKGQTACFPGQGSCAHTVIIGGEVFKGPREARFAANIDREHEILKAMEGRNLPVPKVTCVGKESIFFAMTKVSGVQLGQGFFVNGTEEELRAFAKDLAQFVVGMAEAFPMKGPKFMTHGDMHLGNVFIDPKTKRLAAVIDFGLAAYVGETEIDKVRGTVVRAGDEWLPHLRGSTADFNEMLHEEYRALRKTTPDPTPSPSPSPKGRSFNT